MESEDIQMETTQEQKQSTDQEMNNGSVSIKLDCLNEKNFLKLSEDEMIVDIHLKSPLFIEAKRAPIDLVAVIDRSGSMSDKIVLVKETLKFIVKQFNSKDKLSIVIYDNEVDTVFEFRNMDSTAKERANQAIQSIVPRGSTDLCSGLLKGIANIKKREIKSEVSSILLFTDGLANHGISHIDGIIGEMNKQSDEQGDLPCSIHTFGFGVDHDPNLLKCISDKAKGIYFFVENKDLIANAFADCLGGLLSVVGQNISLTLEGISPAQITNINTGYKVTQSDTKHCVNLGDIQSEEERDILCTIKIGTQSEPVDKLPILKAQLSYFNVITSQQEEISFTATSSRRSEGSVEFNSRVDQQKNRLIVAEAITKAKELGDAGELIKGREIINTALSTLKSSITSNDPYVKELITDLNASMDGLKDRNTYNSVGSRSLTSASHAHSQQRSTISTVSYKTSARDESFNRYTDS